MLHLKLDKIAKNKFVPKLTGGPLLAIVLSKSIQFFRLIHLLSQFGRHKNEMPKVPG